MVRSKLVRMAIAVGLLATTPVAADPGPRGSPADQVWQRFAEMGAPHEDTVAFKDARFAFNNGDVLDPASAGALSGAFDLGFDVQKRTIAFSSNGQAAWLAADLVTYEICGDETCPKKPVVDETYHATALFVGGTGDWQPVFWHVAPVVDTKTYNRRVASGEVPDAVSDKAVKADDVVTLFRSSMATPAALAASVATRSDVVLYGTDRKERYVGGKQVAATLRKWSLAFTVRDGIEAGVAAGGTVAWVAANVDAVSTKKPGAKPSPYRVTAIYERTDAGWKLVDLMFSY